MLNYGRDYSPNRWQKYDKCLELQRDLEINDEKKCEIQKEMRNFVANQQIIINYYKMEQEEEKIPYTYIGLGNSTNLRTIGGREYTYYIGKTNLEACKRNDAQILAFQEFLSEIPTVESRKKVMMEEFLRWETKNPDIQFALWLIEQYKVANIQWRRDRWRLEQVAKGEKKSWEELLKARDEEISELKSQLREKNAIIGQKTKEHDEYVANHSTDDSDGSDWMMKINKADIHLSFREYTIILYTLFRLATNKEELSPNLKRLIGSYNTISSYINDLKKEGRTPLNEKERDNIKKVLNSEKVPYREILKDYL